MDKKKDEATCEVSDEVADLEREIEEMKETLKQEQIKKRDITREQEIITRQS